MQNGWIKIHRKLKENGFYKNSKYVHLWLHILLKANHKNKEIMWNGQLVKIKPGQFITGRKVLAEETGISGTTIERILKCFESGHQIRMMDILCQKGFTKSERVKIFEMVMGFDIGHTELPG